MIYEVKNGTFGYKNNLILNDINFTIRDGEVMSILGPNGVGKTTLLKCMMGLLKWKEGASLLDGQNIKNIKPKEFWQKIAYVPQAKGSAFGFTALDMVTLGRSAHLGIFSQPKAEDKEAARRAMEDMGILHLKDKLCTEMSGGELQMVLIARALTIDPHYPEHALKISDNALILNREGKNIFGKAEEIINEENMKHAFSVQVHINQFHYRGAEYRSVVPLYLI